MNLTFSNVLPKDEVVIKAFIEREAGAFMWNCLKAKQNYIDKMLSQIKAFTTPCNYYHIVSITNLGLTDAKLVLTPLHWEYEGGEYHFLLPTNPRGDGSWQKQHVRKEN